MAHVIRHNPHAPFDQPGKVPVGSTGKPCLSFPCRRIAGTNCRGPAVLACMDFSSPKPAGDAVNEVAPILDSESFTHRRKHNVYFLDDVPGVDRNHPALKKSETINHTVCADQLGQCIVTQIYEYSPLVHFLAGILGKSGLFTMDDPLARVNVMAYRQGEALNWHFDRSEFTVTLLLQSPRAGGHFEYRPDLRSDQDPQLRRGGPVACRS